MFSAFNPEEVAILQAAYSQASENLMLTKSDEAPIKARLEKLAKVIIAIAETGERDHDKLVALAIKDVKAGAIIPHRSGRFVWSRRTNSTAGKAPWSLDRGAEG